MLEWGREYIREVRVNRPVEDAQSLCEDALLQLFRTVPSQPRQPDRFDAWTALKDGRASRNRLRFTFSEADGGTMIRVSTRGASGLWSSVMMPATTRARRSQVDRLADWLVEEGPGEHLGAWTGDIVWFAG